MKPKTTLFKVVCLICILTLISMAFQGIAEATEDVSDASQAMIDAQRDAEAADVEVWMWAGGIFGAFGMLVAALYTPTVPAHRLLGKSSEYVVFYTSTYQQKTKSKQIKEAAKGCAIGTGVAIAILAMMQESNRN